MISPCVIVPYIMWWGKYDVKDLIYGFVVFIIAGSISVWLAKKFIDNSHS